MSARAIIDKHNSLSLSLSLCDEINVDSMFWTIFDVGFTVVKLAIVVAWPLCFGLAAAFLALQPPLDSVLGGFALAGLIASLLLVVVHGAEALALVLCCGDGTPRRSRKDVALVLAFGVFHLWPLLRVERRGAIAVT
jgi:uncharacterized protein YhhL (DUF1145 family)